MTKLPQHPNMNQLSCPCGSALTYLGCCGRYIELQACPPTPESLMRSRYTAYTLAKISYVKHTMQGNASIGFEEQAALKWSTSVVWLGLKILHAYLTDQYTGYVEFIASYVEHHQLKAIHEISEFRAINDRWFYVEGKQIPVPAKLIARNGLCPCGSSKKFKNCHGDSAATTR